MNKKRIFEIIQIGHSEDRASRLFDFFIAIVILLNISVIFLETFQMFQPYLPILRIIEIITTLIFCVEYILRIWTADCLYPGMDRPKAIRSFVFSFDGIVDLFTILSYFFLSGFAAFRIIRIIRIFHLFRINAYYDSLHVITSVISETRNQILSSVFIITIFILAASLCMYSAEHDAQPEAFSNALSGVWWSVSAIFTVGYGDIYPITPLGRLMAVMITFLGVGAVAIPTGIISAGFVEHYSRIKQSTTFHSYKSSTAVIFVDENSRFAGQTIGEIEAKRRICITAVIRNGLVIIPEDNVVIQTGDTLSFLVIE